MSCQLDVATEVKQDILDCNAEARGQIGDFLVALQEIHFQKAGAG
jgi:hypothetical protein